MHLLAHMYLSGNTPSIMVGNFIGEIKTKKEPTAIKKEYSSGLYLHGLIDEFSHNHPVFQRSKNRLDIKYSKIADSVISVFYDHFLAAEWNNYSTIALDVFSANSYRTLLEHQADLTYKAKLILPYMVEGNWLQNCATLNGLHKSIVDFEKRRFAKQLVVHALQDLINNYSAFKEDFKEFFPDLINYVKKIKETDMLRNAESQLEMAS